MDCSWSIICRWLGAGQWHTAQNCSICSQASIEKKGINGILANYWAYRCGSCRLVYS